MKLTLLLVLTTLLFVSQSLFLPKHAQETIAYMYKGDGSPKIYIHFYGCYFWIPNQSVYANLFYRPLSDAPWNVKPQEQVDKTCQDQLSTDAYLVKADNDNKIYLVTSNQKWWVPSENSFNVGYGFSWSKVVVKSAAEVNAIKDAPGKLY